MALTHFGDRQRQLLQLLLRNKQGMTVDELAGRLGVSRTAVHQHLASLSRDGHVERADLASTGGRPGHIYVLTDEGIHLFPKQYSWFSELLLESLKKRLGREGVIDFLRELGREAGTKLQRGLAGLPPERQVEEVAAVMQELGYESRAEKVPGEDLPIIDARNCVYHDLAKSHQEVCELDLALMEAALGRPVQQLECMLRGGHACRFRVGTGDDRADPS